MRSVVTIRSNGQITLPASARRQAKVKEGDTLVVRVDDRGTIHLVPQILVDRDQAYFWTQRWQEGEREADLDLAAGRYADFDSIEAMFAEMDADE